MSNRPLVPALALALACALPAFAEDTVKVETGQILGARFEIASPPGTWNHRLLMIAHGYRPDSAPLVPDLHPDRAWLKAVLDEGWMVATTSYRRNGVVIGDAIKDLDALRAFIATDYGDPERVILEGESMGGLVAVIMAERDRGPYDGAFVVDATLYVKETNAQVGLSLLPRIPLLFVATQREAAGPKGYLTSLVSRPFPVVQPALFLISREGHTNVNQAERMAAFRAVNLWVDKGPDALPKPRDQALYFDATIEVDPGPSTAAIRADGRGFDTRVAEIDAVYGTLLLEAQAADFKAGAIPSMTYCTVQVGGKSYRTLYGRTYSDVRNGEWVAFPDADGRTVLSRNFADAAGTTSLKVGDPVTLVPVDPGIPSRK